MHDFVMVPFLRRLDTPYRAPILLPLKRLSLFYLKFMMDCLPRNMNTDVSRSNFVLFSPSFTDRFWHVAAHRAHAVLVHLDARILKFSSPGIPSLTGWDSWMGFLSVRASRNLTLSTELIQHCVELL